MGHPQIASQRQPDPGADDPPAQHGEGRHGQRAPCVEHAAAAQREPAPAVCPDGLGEAGVGEVGAMAEVGAGGHQAHDAYPVNGADAVGHRGQGVEGMPADAPGVQRDRGDVAVDGERAGL